MESIVIIHESDIRLSADTNFSGSIILKNNLSHFTKNRKILRSIISMYFAIVLMKNHI